MEEDRDGNIWFGVNDSIIRYDGTTWTTFTEKDGVGHGAVDNLCGTRDGTVYAGTHRGLSRFLDGKWTPVLPPSGDLDWPILDLMEASDGRLWCATGWGVLRKDADGWTLFATEEVGESLRSLAPYIRSIVVPQQATDTRKGTSFGAEFLPGSWLSDSGTTIMALTDSLNLAGLSVGDRILRINGERLNANQAVWDDSVAVYTVRRSATADTVEITVNRRERDTTVFVVGSVFEDRDGIFWFGLLGGKIVRFDPLSEGTSTTWRLFDADDGVALGGGVQIGQAGNGNIWTISGDGGVPPNRYAGGRWQPVEMPAGLSNLDTAILTTGDGRLWIGGGGLKSLTKNGEWVRYAGSDGIPNGLGSRPRLLATSDGALWMAARGGYPARLDYATSTYTSYADLSYQCESADGARWFIHEEARVVRHDGRTWTSFGAEDGLMDHPSMLLHDRNGRIWAAGSHAHTAATAVYDGTSWSLTLHPDLAHTIDRRASYEAVNGSLWFSAAIDYHRYGERFRGGLIQYREGNWTHHVPPDAPYSSYGIGNDPLGRLWSSGWRTYRFDDPHWTVQNEPEELTDFVDVLFTGSDALWFGSRVYGVLRYDGESWTRHDARTGLVGNRVRSIAETSNGILVSTSEGVSRFDGSTWTTPCLPPIPVSRLRTSRDGAIWIVDSERIYHRQSRPDYTREARPELSVVRYRPDDDPPDVEVTLWADEVSQPGNTTIAWSGADPWKATPDEEIQYSYRIDDGDWSPYDRRTTRIFQLLSSGAHTFEVRARDRDFNVDPTPASIAFTVIPPVYQQTWFIALMIAFVGVTGYQASRIIVSNRRLTEGNVALSGANHQLFDLNVALQRERSVERVRAEVTSMAAAEDLQPVVQDMLNELATAGVGFDLCVINIIDEDTGVRRQYGATAKGWSGQTETSMVDVSEAFLTIWKAKEPVVREADEDLVRSCLLTRQALGVTDALDRPTSVIDAPFAYGTLSLQSSRAEGFSEDDVALVAEFARVIQLGYARYLDFQNLERQNAELQRDRAVERIRSEVQSMDRVEDFERVLSRLTDGLTSVGLHFESCEIDVLEEPVENPSMSDFETDGFNYTTFRLDPQGNVTSESYNTPAPFPTFALETIERFIQGEPWQGRSEEMSIVEVPAGGYGRLRLSASDRDRFSDDEVATLQQFADAVALGYARYLDIREIHLQTERKSAFLASMSHEFRTPMNAIKGFTNLVLRRGKDELSERNQENLQKVDQASDHLLAMINDLLDLSKIEAGRMDVNPERFDVGDLITSACDTVSPLYQ